MVGARALARAGAECAIAFIVATHCSCSCVIVAEPSDSALMWLNCSTITPTKRFIAKKEPTNIHTIEKSAAGEKSLRT